MACAFNSKRVKMIPIANTTWPIMKIPVTAWFVIFFIVAGNCLGSIESSVSTQEAALVDSIKLFEAQCFDSIQISIGDYHRGLAYYDEMIERMLMLAQQFPDSNYVALAYDWLERKKNLKLLTLLRSGYWPVSSLDGDPNESLSMALDQLRVSSKVGAMLLNAMKHPIAIEAIMEKCIDDKQAIINFWVTQDRIVAFVMSCDSLSVVQWHCSRRLVENKIDLLMKPFYNSSDPFRLEFSVKTAHDLYKLLFQPLEVRLKNAKSICVIPDEMFFGLPFELLLCSLPAHNSVNERALYQELGSLDYLIRHYATSYNYSTALLALITDSYRSMKTLRHRLLTMSEPLAPNKSGIWASKPLLQVNWRNDYEVEEIKRVSRLLFRHDNLRQQQANKSYFLTAGPNYRWIHLTLPAPLDNSNVFESGIIFSCAPDDSVGISAWLTLEELLQSSFSADLLTMGNSQLLSFSSHGNPGVIALPQVFLLAGVRSVIFRLWPVNCLSTSQYLAKFYWELKYKRQTASQALQEAKIASLKETFTLDNREISRAHPFFWAGFQLVGNPQISPPSPTKLPPMAVIGLVYVVVILLSLVITRKTMPKHRKLIFK